MTVSDIIMVIAILLAPVVAVQVQKWVEVFRERHQRKLYVFGTLMATRGSRLSPEHVQALNMIDLAFYGRKILRYRHQTKSEQSITEAWKKYLNQLAATYDKSSDSEVSTWAKGRDSFFYEMLSKMATALGYHFDDVHLQNNIYTPIAYGEKEANQNIILHNLAQVLSGNKSIPMEVTSFPVTDEAIAKQNDVQTKLIEYLDGKRAVKVKIEKDS